METVTFVQPLEDHKLKVIFSDGFHAEIDIRPYIRSNGISNPLIDKEFFKTVQIDEAGGIFWNNGFDFCPVFLRQIAS